MSERRRSQSYNLSDLTGGFDERYVGCGVLGRGGPGCESEVGQIGLTQTSAMNPDRAALDLAIAGAEALVARLKSIRDRPEADPLVPLKVAAAEWGVSEDSALRRAQRGAGEFSFGRWYFRKSTVESGYKPDQRRAAP